MKDSIKMLKLTQSKVWHVTVAAVGKGQREHGSVEMLAAWTMSFPEPYLKDRVLLPVDKTFHLATRALGSRLSGGFPTRPCGQAFYHSPLLLHSRPPFLCIFPSYL